MITLTKSYDFLFIVHGFNKKQQLAEQLLKKGFYLSFGKHLLEKESLQSVFKNTPLNRIFLETDAASNSIESVYKKAASIKEISIESLILAIKNNFENVFKCNISG
jgi:TatD DNase family protein